MRYLSSSLFALSFASASLLSSGAEAAGPCGNFAFDANGQLSCSIKVKAECTANCGVDKLTANCAGQCTAMASTTCSKDECGVQCLKQCNPELLDCFQGCHDECDAPTIALCKQKHPQEDCVKQGVAQCDIHCKNNCKVPDSTCEEHCNNCCVGACQTQANFDCDFGCTVEVKAHCNAKCSAPTGGIFCNGQYVDASDVEACISYLATQGVKVDVSARGSATATCDGDGCAGVGDLKATGCAAAPTPGRYAAGGLATLGLALGALVAAGRRRAR